MAAIVSSCFETVTQPAPAGIGALFFLKGSDDGKSYDIVRVDLRTLVQTVVFNTRDLIVSYNSARNGSALVFASAENGSEPQMLYYLNTLRHVRRVLLSPAPELSHYAYGASKERSWTDSHGTTRPGIIVYPRDYSPDKRYPTIVDIYPGDEALRRFLETVDDVFISPQVFATRGYVVYQPFIDPAFGSPMASIGSQVSEVASSLVVDGIADPNRLGLIGHSFGGHSVFSTLVTTHAYHAAVAFEGVSDIVS